ncbi:MAG: AmmeMemoRadiSam system protein B [Phycisphaeraceae bacterium]|nr:AmmeMemoRadiSam system protein B [Phycisphaeraceae bacterium]
MGVRAAALAGQWYPGDRAGCRSFLDAALARRLPSPIPGPLLGGVVPHAGWVSSGEIAALVFRALAAEDPERTVIVLGAVHRYGLDRPAISPDAAWETPLGDLPVDGSLAEEVSRSCPDLVDVDADAHVPGENSIELQAALVRGLMPEARFLPILVPPTAAAVPFGDALGRMLAASGNPAVVVASTDLTHYGYGGWHPAGAGPEAVRWVREENDRRFLDLVVTLSAERIVPEAEENRNACGAGATAAAVSAVRAMGARRGQVLAQTTSEDVRPSGSFDHFVGYGGVVFTRSPS